MFRWGIIFLVIALIAAALVRFVGGYCCRAAKIVFVVGIILFGQPVHRPFSRPAFSRKL
ncbi:DUF1328 domain-containing protein [Serratia marcescens]|uniref:DUF1328 domain-containing protein n=1 Tax=Serratia marcescens TaxID=615 RepID=A0A939SUF6_SERMA|nr:DUF1328 domain-containing protein [Serratia marcescens]